MQPQRISGYQLFALMLLFQLGTTVIFGFAEEAGRDSWIASLLDTGLGMLIVLGYLLLYRLSGGLPLVDWFPALFGKWLGTPIAWLYPLLFLYDSARIIGDLRFLFPVTILPETPGWVVTGSFLAVILYALLGGIEVLGRVASLLLPVVVVFLVMECLLLGVSGVFHFHNLLPLLGDGWERVGRTLWPTGVTQTFGESIAFSLVWADVVAGMDRSGRSGQAGGQRMRHVFGVSLGATAAAGLIIALLNLLTVAGLGEAVFRQMTYPAFALQKLSSVADFIENLDALGIINLVVTSFIKLSFYLYAAAVCVRRLTAAAGDRVILPVLSAVVYIMGMSVSGTFSEHMAVAKGTLPMRLWVPLFFVLPGAALAAAIIRAMRKGAAA